ncbi:MULTISPECIES: sialidase family protein [unclassified Paenibacillus]|uniref:sialidase family protein n=1 Tax=unclassified Paenibacillus TaxID=185978 RepID=UPI003642CDC6
MRMMLVNQGVDKDGTLRSRYNGGAEAYIPTAYRVNHAPSMAELGNGDLLAVWFAGHTEEGRSDIEIVMSRLKAGETQWSEPVKVSDDDTKSEQNPVLFLAPDGKLLLMYTAQEAASMSREEFKKLYPNRTFTRQETAVIRCRESLDGGWTWGAAKTMFESEGSFCRAPIHVAKDGSWLFPMWYSRADGETEYGSDYSVIQRSMDQGKTWKEIPVPNSRGRVHASLLSGEGANMLALFRSRAADRIYISKSSDFGCTWTEPERTVLPNNNASIRAIRLQSNRLAVIYNHSSANDDPHLTVWPKVRYPVTVALSEDEGLTWPYRRIIETGDGFSGENNESLNRKYEYPWILQTNDGLLHAAFAYGGREGIKHVVFTEAWVKGTDK